MEKKEPLSIDKVWQLKLPELQRFVASRIGALSGEFDADDIVQETFESICKHPDKVAQLSDVESISGWIFQIAKHKIVDRIRKAKALKRTVPNGEKVGPDFLASVAASQRTPSSFVAHGEAKQHLALAMSALKERQARAIELRYFKQLSYADVAEILGTTVAATQMLVKRAVQALRTELGNPSRLL